MHEILSITEALTKHLHVPDVCSAEYTAALRLHTAHKIDGLLKRKTDDADRKHDLVVLDMDGTLYPLDGEQNGFKNSTKERFLTNGFIDYIVSKEPDLSYHEAIALFQETLKHPIGPSVFLAQRYRVRREIIFASIWDALDTDIIVGTPEYDTPKILMDIRQRTKLLLLLTAAPAIWQRKVCAHLKIDAAQFDAVMTTAEFVSKSEVFSAIARAAPGIRGVSVGDSLKSDIEPAESAGLSAIHINDKMRFKDVPALLDTLSP
jgi:FMN phosphatase YigB (HAD superfamily)